MCRVSENVNVKTSSRLFRRIPISLTNRPCSFLEQKTCLGDKDYSYLKS